MTIQEIKTYMKKQKITYSELARRTGISKSAIEKIFAGTHQNPRIDTVQAIERALGLDGEVMATAGEIVSPDEYDLLTNYRLLPPSAKANLLALSEQMANLAQKK